VKQILTAVAGGVKNRDGKQAKGKETNNGKCKIN